MSVELHLPDLPEVPVALGNEPGGPCGPRLAWRARLVSLVGTALPLVLMMLLALGTWWLVKNSPQPPGERVQAAPRHEPDYTVRHFTLQRYEPTGRLAVEIEGEHLRHYPDSSELEIDTVHVRAHHIDGRLTRATAREALANDDGSRVQLVGGAHVISLDASGTDTVELFGEELVADFKARQILSDRPVLVRQGRNEFTATAMQYDEATRTVTAQGPVRAVWQSASVPKR
jgi:lipopolysaccharide export system protein LptC